MASIVVKSAAGRVLKDPANGYRPLLDEGSVVEDSAYWRRRIDEGDAVLVEPDPPIPVPLPGDVKASKSTAGDSAAKVDGGG